MTTEDYADMYAGLNDTRHHLSKAVELISFLNDVTDGVYDD